MRYDPKAAQGDLLPEGWYDATLAACETVSKSKNPMLVVEAAVYYQAKSHHIDTYLVLNNKGGLTRLKKLCQALDIDFDRGEITPAMISGKGCRVEIKIEEDQTGKYWDKNVIAKFEKMEVGQAEPAVPPDEKDPIPF